ncbi:Bug family tripartite tricarboxylate transporter substrate binding protein [Roseomonas sp. BN140053]|uniref:Bug family tripartite tricarboxylate transporter substrate binding protein n=1 Tax=Roseomonas sp. BN140053 TaxID=3391898 RepID=UPI0039E95B9F
MTRQPRRRMLLATLLALAAGAAPALAQTPAAGSAWTPDRPVRLIANGAPGSGADTAARAVAQGMAEITRATIVVENQSGGGGAVGILAAAHSRPDGLTLLAAVSGVLLGPLIDRTLPYDVFRDLAPVSQINRSTAVLLVNNNTPATTLREFLDLVRAAPGRFDMGNFGYGSSSHLQGEMLARRAGVQWQPVPFQSSPPLIRDMLAGHICCGVSDLGSAREMLRDKLLRPLAVSGTGRSFLLPEVPTFAEQGITGLEPIIWQGIFAPAGTPEPVLNFWSRAAAAALRRPEVAAVLRGNGSETVGNTPAEFAAFLRDQQARWKAIVDETGIRIH